MSRHFRGASVFVLMSVAACSSQVEPAGRSSAASTDRSEDTEVPDSGAGDASEEASAESTSSSSTADDVRAFDPSGQGRVPGQVTALIDRAMAEGPAAMDELFRSGWVPPSLPRGCAVGKHALPLGNVVEGEPLVPAGFDDPDFHGAGSAGGWLGKCFFAGSAEDPLARFPDGAFMTEVLTEKKSDFGVKAAVRFGKLPELIDFREKPASWWPAIAEPAEYASPSIITDYRPESYEGDLAFLSPVRPWLDELRQIDPVNPKLYLGRSTYQGAFWGYVVLYFVDPSERLE